MARHRLQELETVLEPTMQTLHQDIHGIVSREKQQGTKEYNGWAWLMFTNARLGENGSWKGKPVGAHDLTQLTINISRRFLYAGLCVKKEDDKEKLQKSLQRRENETLLGDIARVLGPRKWIITARDQSFSDEPFRQYDQNEIRVALLDPKTRWINFRWDRYDATINSGRIVTAIFTVFRTLFPLYALSLGLEIPPIPKLKGKPWETSIVIDQEPSKILTDHDAGARVDSFMQTLSAGPLPHKFNSKGGDQIYKIQRIIRPLSPRLDTCTARDGKTRVAYLDSGFTKDDIERRVAAYDEFRLLLDKLASTLGKDSSFLQIILTHPTTDARKWRSTGSSHILLNLLRYENNRSEYFWIITLAREIAYLFTPFLTYRHQKMMRDVLVNMLSSWKMQG